MVALLFLRLLQLTFAKKGSRVTYASRLDPERPQAASSADQGCRVSIEHFAGQVRCALCPTLVPSASEVRFATVRRGTVKYGQYKQYVQYVSITHEGPERSSPGWKSLSMKRSIHFTYVCRREWKEHVTARYRADSEIAKGTARMTWISLCDGLLIRFSSIFSMYDLFA